MRLVYALVESLLDLVSVTRVYVRSRDWMVREHARRGTACWLLNRGSGRLKFTDVPKNHVVCYGTFGRCVRELLL